MKEEKDKDVKGLAEVSKVIDVAKQMKEFYVETHSSTLDLQNRVKGCGFSFLNMN
jgi:hypothetical protein